MKREARISFATTDDGDRAAFGQLFKEFPNLAADWNDDGTFNVINAPASQVNGFSCMKVAGSIRVIPTVVRTFGEIDYHIEADTYKIIGFLYHSLSPSPKYACSFPFGPHFLGLRQNWKADMNESAQYSEEYLSWIEETLRTLSLNEMPLFKREDA